MIKFLLLFSFNCSVVNPDPKFHHGSEWIVSDLDLERMKEHINKNFIFNFRFVDSENVWEYLFLQYEI